MSQRYMIRRNLLTIIGFCLCAYFTYHIAFGDRSWAQLQSLERETAKISIEYETLHKQRVSLESRVVRLRPGSLDPDLLEERARYVLGYVRPDESVIIRTN